MKSDFLLAITQLSAEKNLPSEVVLAAVEAALVSAYRKDYFSPTQNISVKINSSSGDVQVWAEKAVVQNPSDTSTEISLEDARRIKGDVEIGENLLVESTPHNAGRIAAQTAKQVILQRLHDAEHSAIFEEYAGREGDIVTGLVQRIESRQIFIDLGRTEAILPVSEQVSNERYRIGQRLKVTILEVARTAKGPRVIVSRSHPDLLRRLFEMEVPEIFSGTVELKAIAREAGSRSKVAVAARQEGVDPVGCCVGLRGIRIQNIANELNGEKIDVVMWHPDVATFIASALSPAQILNVTLDKAEVVATVVVPDRQLSLAIGKEGQNVRLAAKLAGWRIDIRSASVVEAEKEAAARILAESAVAEEAPVQLTPDEIPPVLEPVLPSAKVEVTEAVEEVEDAEPMPALDAVFTPPPAAEMLTDNKPSLRFAEDILSPGPAKIQPKSKKKKKKGQREREVEDDRYVLRKSRREQELLLDDSIDDSVLGDDGED